VEVRGDLVLSSYFIDATFVDIADGDELRAPFRREYRVDARVLLAEMANADDCGAKHKSDQRSDVSVRF